MTTTPAFQFPHRFSVIANDAFDNKATDDSHTHHGLTPQFTSLMDDNFRALEDYLGSSRFVAQQASIVIATVGQTLTAGTSTLNHLTFDTVLSDDLGYWDAVNNRFNIAAAGTYLISAGVKFPWESHSPGYTRGVSIIGQGRTLMRSNGPAATDGTDTTSISVSTVCKFAAGDQVFAAAISTTGVTLDVGEYGMPQFNIIRAAV